MERIFPAAASCPRPAVWQPALPRNAKCALSQTRNLWNKKNLVGPRIFYLGARRKAADIDISSFGVERAEDVAGFTGYCFCRGEIFLRSGRAGRTGPRRGLRRLLARRTRHFARRPALSAFGCRLRRHWLARLGHIR